MVRLRSLGLSSTYRRGLRDAGYSLLNRVHRLGGVLDKHTPIRRVDRWLERAVEVAYEEGESVQWMVLGVLSLQRAFRISGSGLKGTWLAIKNWKASLPHHTRVPLSRSGMEALVLTMFASGASSCGYDRRTWWACALATWLSFVCLLRPGETLKLRVDDLTFPDGSSLVEGAAGLVVVVRNPKTKRIWKTQFVLCSENPLIQWLAWWVRGIPRHQWLFPLTRYVWNTRFNSGLDRLALRSCGFTLGSLRTGGATYHFRVHQNLALLQYHGRWASSDTLKYYLHSAMSVHVMSNISEEAKGRLEVALSNVALLLNPPLSLNRLSL